MAVLKNGELWGWGENTDGQLGNGEYYVRDPDFPGWGFGFLIEMNPIKIMDEVKNIFVCDNNNFAIKTNGELWGWGENRYGHLRDGTAEMRRLPILISVPEDCGECAVCDNFGVPHTNFYDIKFPATAMILLILISTGLWIYSSKLKSRLKCSEIST